MTEALRAASLALPVSGIALAALVPGHGLRATEPRGVANTTGPPTCDSACRKAGKEKRGNEKDVRNGKPLAPWFKLGVAATSFGLRVELVVDAAPGAQMKRALSARASTRAQPRMGRS